MESPDNTEARFPNDLFYFWVTGVYKAIKRAVGDNPVRIHFGKSSLRNHCEIKDSYPMMDEFIEIREQLDPNGNFINQMVRDKLGLCGECCCTFDTCNKTEILYSDVDWTCEYFDHYTTNIPKSSSSQGTPYPDTSETTTVTTDDANNPKQTAVVATCLILHLLICKLLTC